MSYSGELTRYYGNCIYELDNEFKLYLTQYDLEDTIGRGLRVGAQITAHNIHPIRLRGRVHVSTCNLAFDMCQTTDTSRSGIRMLCVQHGASNVVLAHPHCFQTYHANH